MKILKWLTYGLILVVLSMAHVANAMDIDNSQVGITFEEGTDSSGKDSTEDNKITDKPNLNQNGNFPQTSEKNYSQQITYIGIGVSILGGILLYKKERGII
ncbi:hypothetical protein ACWOFR_05665 [Carnobacterium gallinarum]